MSEKTQEELLKHYVERLSNTLVNYRAAFEERLMGLPYPSELFPPGYISAIHHYMAKFMEYSIFPPDILRRLYVAKIVPESITVENTKQILDFNELLTELIHYIRGE